MKPRLSVVVPVHNVEDHLEDCLRSVAGQSVGDIEVVLVDDGSTDGSTAIAESFAAHDRRFRYVRRPNGGPGAARNTGVRHTTPDVPYLAFVDSDDVVVHDGYARMLASLESTGSDLATGNVWQLTEQGRQQARQYHWLTGSRARTHIGRDPRLLADRVAWNKVFRRSFWDRHAFAFPEGRLYEDTPVTIPAHYLVSSVDVLHEHVHYWRVREGSIGLRRTDVKGVRDRISACEQVSAFLAGRGGVANGGARRRYDLSCLRDDFVYFLDGLPMGGPEYREAFMADAGAFLDRMERMDGAGRADRAVAHEFPVSLRIKWQLVKERLPRSCWRCWPSNGPTAPGRSRSAGCRADGRPASPASRTPSASPGPISRPCPGCWTHAGATTGSCGCAVTRTSAICSTTTPRHSLKMGMVRATQGQVLRTVPVRGVLAPEATVDSGQQLHRYDHSGFEMTLDPRRLRPGGWMVGMMVAAQGTVRRVAVRAMETGAAQPLVHDLGDGRRAVLDYRGGRLRLTLTQLPARCESHRFGTDLELTGRLRTRASGRRPWC